MSTVISTQQAYNILIHESILQFQFSSNVLSGSARICVDDNTDIPTATCAAFEEIMEEFPPDVSHTAIVLGHASVDLQDAVSYLIDVRHCKLVYVLEDEQDLFNMYPFLLSGLGKHCYPSEVYEDIYLGGEISVDSSVLTDLNINCVVSCIDRRVVVPQCVSSHMLCFISDDENESIGDSLEKAIPFIEEATRLNKKVLIHCERGKSRSVSVMIGYMLHAKLANSVDEALGHIRSCRPIAHPNQGFMKQLFEYSELCKKNN